MGKLVLVTGAAGFIGSHLCDGLLAAGLRVRGADNLSFGSRDNLRQALNHPAFELVEAELKDASACASACDGVAAVLHHAARVGVPDSLRDPEACRRDTLATTEHLLRAAAAAGVQRFVLASTAAVYGDATCPVREDAATNPLSPYGEFKLAAEAALRESGLEGVSLRYFNVYGPRQSPLSPYAGVVTLFADRLRRNQPITIYGDGHQRRDFLHVSDVVRANLAALRCAERLGGRSVNIGSGVGVTMLELAAMLGRALGREPSVQHKPPRAGDIRESWADTTLAQAVLGFTAQRNLSDGLREMLETT
ncbi:MAG: NAD-dependent epimerase/dehydratase family protein [Planctomycetes bacterium]|nr:NAD-dependent epimerase/dehydratase family protein [Planctomycetota bacterium]